jgi:esterase/lipase
MVKKTKNLHKVKKKARPEHLNHCIVREYQGEDKKGSMIFMHGFTSFPQMQSSLAKDYGELGYDTYQCPLRGHRNGRKKYKGSKMDWKDSLKDLDDLVNYVDATQDGEIILMGQSLGATLAISEANKNKKVDKVFAFGGANSKKMILENQDRYRRIFKKAGVDFDKYDPEEERFMMVLPHDLNECLEDNDERFFLVHSRTDNVVPFTEMEKNQKELCLSDDNVLIYEMHDTNHHPAFLHQPHVMPIYKPKSKRWVKNKLKKERKKIKKQNKKSSHSKKQKKMK